MEFAYKVWIEKDGNTVFGMGIYKLLDLVAETGSLHKAAQELGMSYRAAWGKVREYEERLGIGLLEKGRHGRTGASLTREGEQILKHFQEILKEMDRLVSTGPLSRIIDKIEDIGPAQE
ncbi:MAG: winged helix-turn-helix domain-containing protein [Desulfomonilia bacterium]|jgi:molybdate transport system regulatory protein|uniref:Bacterial regulatory helix-turn-helix protein, lysR family n=1 Tax=anaerobic digester metagenome TaxID=1263854 RepID=A0A485M152_9ZZZZ|nr:LysR family transcriptional regulator [Pseudomonadota bacterium]HON39156.1 LysR family transcriptional regulator [Deltaproteobacteria bacterium]HRS57012.1 LysR family transcriptional regulator [Desulfomonilia bacterium]HPD20293.1 LysR family transcriptional regulator [Deltaproteobacteria bacterium]HPX17679.1 LysR family transcriptional regulator [Deltaproteobacteria bacterium]